MTIDAVKTYAQRFVTLAKEMAETAAAKRRRELLEIAAICERVPYYPARTLQKLCNRFGSSNVFCKLNQTVIPFLTGVSINTCILMLKQI